MKCLVITGCCLFALASLALAKENTRFYRQISLAVSYSYHFAGLWPSTPQEKVEKYEFILDDRDYPVRITHYGLKGSIVNNEEGWALYKIQYDSQGRLIESSFFNADGKPTLGKSVGFSKEVVEYDGLGEKTSRYYSSNGRLLKVPESAQIDSFKSLSP